jgi:cell division protein FtsQ
MKRKILNLKADKISSFFPLLKGLGMLALMVFLWGFALKRQQSRVVNSIRIEIENEAENHFVDDAEVENAISVGKNNMVYMRWLDSVSLDKLERRVEQIPFVKKAEVSMDLTNNLHVQVELVKPVARVLAGGSDFDRYIGSDGEVLPTSEKYTSKVITVDGPGSRKMAYAGFMADSNCRAILSLLKTIHEDKFWSAQITHMTIDKDYQITLSTQVGGQEIEFGPPSDPAVKLEKLMAFYEKIVPTRGWNAFRRVSVKFRNQIVCQKTSL